MSTPRKNTIAWLDHEGEKVDLIIKKIGAMKRIISTNEYLNDCYSFASVIVKPLGVSESMDKFVERAMSKIGKNCVSEPDLILVDLNFGEHDNPSIDKGRDLALALRKALYPTPVGVYTAHEIPNVAKVMISADGLLLLEGITRLYEGTSRLMGDDWHNLFQRVISEAKTKSRATPPIIASDQVDSVTWALGHPRTRSPSFKKVALKLTSLSLGWVEPKPERVILTQLAGGFSGSFVVKAEIPGRRTAYVIKIDEDPKRLQDELLGHQRVRSLVGFSYYLPLLTPDMSHPITLSDQWWGAFAMAYEGDAKPLIEHTRLNGKSLGRIYGRLWSECLFDLYGSVSGSTTVNALDLLNPERKAAVHQGWASMSRYRSSLGALTSAHRRSLNHALTWARSAKRGAAKPDTFDTPTVGQVHGDLNCRNVLYNAERDTFRLIDFPHVGPVTFLAADFVKAEAELILIMLDWNTGRDMDFNRLKVWGTLTNALSNNINIRERGIPDDNETKRILAAVKTVRSSYMSVATKVGTPGRAYLMYLLATVLNYVNYADVSIPKRFLALIWAGQLLQQSKVLIK